MIPFTPQIDVKIILEEKKLSNNFAFHIYFPYYMHYKYFSLPCFPTYFHSTPVTAMQQKYVKL